MKPRVGKVRRGVRRALVASQGAPLLTRDLLRWCYPRASRFKQDHYRALHHAAPTFAVKLRRSPIGRGRPWLWAPSDELLRWIKGDSVG